jgi:hypothetical protein
MAIGTEAKRDGERPIDQLLPPGENSGFETKAPGVHAGSFSFIGEQWREGAEQERHTDYLEHPLYARYMQLPKALLPPRKAGILEEVYDGLSREGAGKLLFAGGWAAAEAAIVMRNAPLSARQRLIEGAAEVWARAYERTRAIQATGREKDDHFCLKERVELALASLPLIEGIVVGQVSKSAVETSLDAYITIGQSNNAFGLRKSAEGDDKRGSFHKGLSYEILALLGLNKDLSTRRFAIPATARSDSGYFSPRFTHDLMVVRQRSEELKSVVPVEIKTRASKHDKKRYRALIIDGDAMDVIEAGEPGPLIDLLAQVTQGAGTDNEREKADVLTKRLWKMAAQYSAGNTLKTGSKDTIFHFHDSSKVRLGNHALYGEARTA